MGHIPKFTEFTPEGNPSQQRFIETVVNDIVPKAYNNTQFVILSGSRGSGKSVGVEYLINYLSLTIPNLITIMSRISVDEIKKNMFDELMQMAPEKLLKEALKESITYKNGSTVECFGYGDGNVRRIRGNNCHIWVMEECTEDDGKTGNHGLNGLAIAEVAMVARNPGGPNIVFLPCNPVGQDHWLYENYISKAGYVDGEPTNIADKNEDVHVFYSLTGDNPYLKKGYVETLRKNLSPKQAERDLYGRWVDLYTNTIYSDYSDELHYKDIDYVVDTSKPMYLSWDFNTGIGKPMSACWGQFINDHLHIAGEVILENANTYKTMAELESRGFFKQFTQQELIIVGDASGWARQTAGKASGGDLSDYGIIKDFLDHLPYHVNYRIKAPVSNPQLKVRHNLVNSYLKNHLGEIRVSIYKTKVLAKGLKTTSLKKGANYIENDQLFEQHVTTSFGYMLSYAIQASATSITKIKR